MVDIRELARRSGVSPATVSRALNDRADVSPDTRARIIELAAELGYSPSQPARTLARKRSDTIGLIWDTGYDADGRRQPFLQDLLIALKRPLSDAGYHLMLMATARNDAGIDTYLRATRQHSLDGTILMGVDERHPAITALIDAYRRQDYVVGEMHPIDHQHGQGQTLQAAAHQLRQLALGAVDKALAHCTLAGASGHNSRGQRLQ